MALVRNRTTEELTTTNQFLDWLKSSDGGNTSIPGDQLTTEIMNAWGYDPVVEGAQPTGEPWQHVEGDGVELDGLGNWRTKFKLVPTFESQEDEDAHVAEWTAAQLKAQTPASISDRQFFEALSDLGHIPYSEALAAVQTGAIPTDMEDFLQLMASFDEAGAQKARLLLAGATTFERDNYLVPVFGSMYGMTEEQIDALWRYGVTL